MSIVTDSTPLEAPKNPVGETTFALYSLLATPEQTEEMRQNYLRGGYGYGHAKQALFELIREKYRVERERFDFYLNHLDELEAELQAGEEKARQVALRTIGRVREVLGF